MNLGAALQAFAAVFPAELPDKTMIAVVVLVARYKQPWPVWCGAAAAFTLHVIVAVAAGRLLTLLPDAVVAVATAVMFAAGAVVLWREAGRHDPGDGDDDEDAADGPANAIELKNRTFRGIFAGSFVVVGLAEWGDLTQLATAGVAASTGAPVAVAVGALAALWAVAGLAATLGQSLVARLPIHALQRTAAVVFGILAVLALLSAR